MKKILKYSFIGLAALCTALLCGGYYMLGHALNPDELITRSRNSQASYEYMFGQYPELKPWVDSLQTAGALRDFYIKNDRGETLHALYVAAAEPTRKTAVIVHGYTDNSIRMLNIGYLYNRQLKYNILLPDLHGHGASEGAEIQMGWLDRLEHCNNNWEDVFFITLARNYGFGLNGDAFEAWAELLPFRALDKHRNDLFQIEALFYGMAGLFEDTFLKEEQKDEYCLRLSKEFHYLQRKFEIFRVMDATLWRFLRLRPDNFPHIRLAQLAYLYQKGDKLFSRLLEAETLAEVRILLSTRTSVYWENHYIFGRTSPQREKLLGEQSKDLIIINTVVPFLYTYGLHKADEGMCERAGRFLEELKAENNHIIRSWSDAGLPVASAADSQALIQLQKEYCDKRKCLYCRFGYEYLRKK